MTECERPDCSSTASGIYEIDDPPAGVLRVRLCDGCAPDLPPVRTLEE